MRRKLVGLLILVGLFCMMITPAYANTYTGGDDWTVQFNQNNEMVSSFKTSDLDDVIEEMQPGDTAVFTLSLENRNTYDTNWYMTNAVLDSLEDDSKTASGGAYTYTLIYTDKNGEERVLFDSDTVGGEDISNDREGLNEATDALEDFFYLDTLTNGQSGSIELTVSLDGETQGNDYQDTLANLQMNFAVEVLTTITRGPTPSFTEITSSTNPYNPTSPAHSSTAGGTQIVQTGDVDLTPYFIAAGISGVLLLLFAVFSIKNRRKQRRVAA